MQNKKAKLTAPVQATAPVNVTANEKSTVQNEYCKNLQIAFNDLDNKYKLLQNSHRETIDKYCILLEERSKAINTERANRDLLDLAILTSNYLPLN